MTMVSPENTNWLYGLLDDIAVPDANFSVPTSSAFNWHVQTLNNSLSVEIDGSKGNSSVLKEAGSKKRLRSESCSGSSSKACREKMRRDKLNDKFMELGAILDPGRPPRTDKAAILIDTTRMIMYCVPEPRKEKNRKWRHGRLIQAVSAERKPMPYTTVTSDSLWYDILEFAKLKYQFDFPEDARSRVKKISVIWNFCQKCRNLTGATEESAV